MKLYSQLDVSLPDSLLLLQGCPGIGKTTELFGWVQKRSEESTVLWIHYDKQQGVALVVCTPTAFIYRHITGISDIEVFVCCATSVY